MKLSFYILFTGVFQLLAISSFSQQPQSQTPSTPIITFKQLKLVAAKLDSNNTVIAVKMEAPAKETIEVTLTHNIGWVVEKMSVKLEPGVNSFFFNISQLAEGNYRLILRNANNTWTASQLIKK